jgi:hypothetical protein
MKTITIVSVVDVVGALADESLNYNIYLFDNNKTSGSQNLGTDCLKTKVSVGDRLLWTIMAMEPESYSAINQITIDKTVCEPALRTYEGSDVTFWEGIVKKDIEEVPYSISFAFGNKDTIISTDTHSTPSLIGTETN